MSEWLFIYYIRNKWLLSRPKITGNVTTACASIKQACSIIILCSSRVTNGNFTRAVLSSRQRNVGIPECATVLSARETGLLIWWGHKWRYTKCDNLIPGMAAACCWGVESGKLMYHSTFGDVPTCVYMGHRPNPNCGLTSGFSTMTMPLRMMR
jgi:hypothetical protein